MKKQIKARHIALCVSALAVIISIINLFVGGFQSSQVAILGGMIAIFCANIAAYRSEKKKAGEDSKHE